MATKASVEISDNFSWT